MRCRPSPGSTPCAGPPRRAGSTRACRLSPAATAARFGAERAAAQGLGPSGLSPAATAARFGAAWAFLLLFASAAFAEPAAGDWGWTGIAAVTDQTMYGARVVCPYRPKERVVQIAAVDAGSPAARAGIVEGEFLTRIGDQAVDVVEARRALFGLAPGEHLRLSLLRSTGDASVELVAEPRPLRELLLARMEAAALWLCSKQQRTGGWTYTTVSGTAGLSIPVSALVQYALAEFPAARETPEAREAVRHALDRGAAHLWAAQKPDGGLDMGGNVRYRIFANAFALLAFQAMDPAKDEARQRQLRDFLVRSQVVESGEGIPAGHVAIGGWNYHDALVAENLKVEVTVTACALEALAATKRWESPELAECFRRAGAFVDRCQNVPRPGRKENPEWDDGGFHTAPEGSKAGEREIELELFRHRSYGSATADGLRALAYVGAPPDDPRIARARDWLPLEFAPRRNPGFRAEAPVPYDRAIYYYWTASLAKALEAVGAQTLKSPDPAASPRDWARELAIELLARQQVHGAWKNPVPLMSEDDPVVATALALVTLNVVEKHLR